MRQPNISMKNFSHGNSRETGMLEIGLVMDMAMLMYFVLAE